MASDWIKMRVDLCEQVEVVQMTALLKMDAYAVIGRLHKLWAWVDKNSLDGQKMPITFAWIDDYVSCKNFANSLQKSGWLKGKDGAISFPNFGRHNGKTAKERAESGRRMEKSRAQQALRSRDGNVAQKTQQKPQPEKNKNREDTCISPERNPSNKTPLPPLRKGTVMSELSVLPWGVGLPDGVSNAELLRIDTENCDADIRDLDTGQVWFNFGPRWEKPEPRLKAVDGGG